MKKLVLFTLLAGLVGCASAPDVVDLTDESTVASLPDLLVNEYVYFLDNRMQGLGFLRGYLVLSSNSESLTLAMRSVNLDTRKESYKEVIFRVYRDAKLRHQIFLRRGESDPSFDLDIKDAEFFITLLPEVSYIDGPFVQLPASHPIHPSVRVSFSMLFPVFNIMRMDFPENQWEMSYRLYRAGSIDDNDFSLFQNLDYIKPIEVQGEFRLGSSNRYRTPIKYIEAELDTRWYRQEDGSYWLQAFGIRDAYINCELNTEILPRLKMIFMKLPPEVYDLLFFRLLLNTMPVDFTTLELDFKTYGSILRINTIDDDGIRTWHYLNLERMGTMYLLVSLGGFNHVIFKNREYFERILTSIRLNTTPPSSE